MEARAFPGPELLEGCRELAWDCCENTRKSEMFGVSIVSASCVPCHGPGGGQVEALPCPREWTLRQPLPS